MQHTLDRFEAAFYSPLLSDWSNYESWVERGALTATDRAHQIFFDTLKAHEPPAMDATRLEELDDFVARRTAEGGADIDR